MFILTYAWLPFRFFIIIQSTTGAPKIAVTVLMLSSVGASIVFASRSQNRQNTLPPRKQAGIIQMGSMVFKSFITRWGAAIPTKEIGPANATMHADKILEKTTMHARSIRIFTPAFLA